MVASLTMWSSSGRRDDQVAPIMKPSFLRSGKRAKNGPNGGKNGRPSLNIEEMNVNETHCGIEVSLDAPFKEESRDPSHSYQREPVISFKQQFRQRQRVHRSQFSVSFPALDPRGESSSSTGSNMGRWRPKDHRIPLLGVSLPEPAYVDALNLLRNSQVSNEYGAVSHELALMTDEIGALEKDRNRLESDLTKMSSSSTHFAAGKTEGNAIEWDGRRLLELHELPPEDRKKLQFKRGNCLTFSLQSPKAKETLLSKCGAKLGQLNSNKRRAPGDTVTITPTNCKGGGAAGNVRHIALMSKESGSNSSFFLSRDTGKSQTWGHISAKLYRRINQAGSLGHEITDIVYLSTGPRGCYFVEFRSGEVWWGNAVEDNDFHRILEEWDVYRVVFGPIEVFEDECGNSQIANSWIIIGRDGRAAWKNLPSRLHHRLESRLANWAAPAEISLGPGDSYFVRFLDGSIDYCLPAEVARVCDHIERYGGSITEIALHPEISHDFLIRHTEMG